ncbi:RbsD/FucU domain-containing protein [Clostridium grantii]|uniref:L-fucose mutarotase n=1 Tax=Clostridium grantii DSM 8605 TaxID=1121316 RepID=A0A1M5U3H5_9CLOT|nr:RbsD/FucU domain-containing protein [Clostridium grantii]SHH57572.1 L-fucose mutarotase [Clostridium grantii DSM 8605]
MLYGIPKTFTPDLMKLLMEVGHGEQLLICDGNFPYKSRNKDTVFILNIKISDLLNDILKFLPLDHAVEIPTMVMSGALDNGTADVYKKIISKYREGDSLGTIDRFGFYDLSDQVVGIIVTNDFTKFGNIIIQKGIVVEEN